MSGKVNNHTTSTYSSSNRVRYSCILSNGHEFRTCKVYLVKTFPNW